MATAFGYKTILAANVQEFKTSSYWKKPAGVTLVMVELWGGGGGGGSGKSSSLGTNVMGGGGGGGGAYNYRIFNAACLISTVLVTIAAGGAGGATVTGGASCGNNGTAGGASGFGELITANSISFGLYLSAFGGYFGSGGANSCRTYYGGGGGGAFPSFGGISQSPGAPARQNLNSATLATTGAFGGQAVVGTLTISCSARYAGEFGGASGGVPQRACGFAGTDGLAAVLGGAGGGAGGSKHSCTYSYGGSGGGRIWVAASSCQKGAAGGQGAIGNAGCVLSTTQKQITLGFGGGGGGVNASAGFAGGKGSFGGGGGGGGGGAGCSGTSGAGGAGGAGFARISSW